jgi:hypothetical protein
VIAVAGREVEDLPFKRGLIIVGALGLLEAILVALFESRGRGDYAAAVLLERICSAVLAAVSPWLLMTCRVSSLCDALVLHPF